MAPVSRRAALGFFGAAAAGVARPAAAQLGPAPFGASGGAAPGVRFARVSVDTRPLAALGSGTAAELVERDLQRSLADVFADRMGARGGAILLVRVRSIFLPPYTGGGAGGAKENGPDSMDGVGAVVSGGRALSETPLLATLDPAHSGAWYLPNIDELRVASLSHQFAYWLRREMGI